MDTASPPPFTLCQTGAALLIGSAASLIIGLQPLLLGELAEKGALSMEGVGVVAMVEIITLGLGVALGDAVLPVSRHASIAVAAALLAAVLDAATAAASGDGAFIALRAAAGFAEGVLVWVAASVIVRARKPDRFAAVFVVVQTVSQAGMAALLATLVLPHGGWQDGFHVLGAVTLACSLLVPFLPYRLAPLAARSTEKLVWSGATMLPLAVAFFQTAAIGSLWAYMQPLAMSAGFDARSAQTLISEVLLMQVAGGVAAAGLVRRLGVVATLGSGGAVLAVLTGGIGLLPAGAAPVFAVLCAAFSFVSLFLVPFQLGLAFRADGRGRVAMLIPAAQLLGSAFGPLVASMVVSGDDAAPVPLIGLGFAVGALALVAFGGRRRAHARAAGDLRGAGRQSFTGRRSGGTRRSTT